MDIYDNGPLKSAILEEISATVVDIGRLAARPSVCRRWGMSPDHPFSVKVGADIESRVTDAKGIAVVSDSALSAFYDNAYDLLCKYPFVDGTRIELNPAPGHPLDFIRTFEDLRQRFYAVAALPELGINHARFGRGQYHLSFQQGNKVFFPRPFYDAIANFLWTEQQAAPAAYVHPLKAENSAPGGAVTQRFGVCWQKSKSIRNTGMSRYENDAPRFELRIATLAPYLPVLLLLNATKKVLLLGEPEGKVKPKPFKRVLAAIRRRPAHERVTPDFHCKSENIAGGRDGYLRFLRRTLKNDVLGQQFPQVAGLAYLQMIDDYRSYLRTPYKGRYTPNDKRERRDLCDSFEQQVRRRFSLESTANATGQHAVAQTMTPDIRRIAAVPG